MEQRKVVRKKTVKKENKFGKFVFILIIILVVTAIAYIGKYINKLYNNYVENKNNEQSQEVKIYEQKVNIYD